MPANALLKQQISPSQCVSVDSDALLCLLNTTLQGPQRPSTVEQTEPELQDEATSSFLHHEDQARDIFKYSDRPQGTMITDQHSPPPHITGSHISSPPRHSPLQAQQKTRPSSDTPNTPEVIDLLDSSSSDEEDAPFTAFPTTARKLHRVINSDDESDSSEERHGGASNYDSDSGWTGGRQAPASASIRRHLVIDDDDDDNEDGEYPLPSSSAKPYDMTAGSGRVSIPLTTSSKFNVDALQSTAARKPNNSLTTTTTSGSERHLPLALQGKPLAAGAFKKEREAISRRLYIEYNAKIFDGELPEGLEIKWNNRLATTAGMTHYKREFPPGQPPRYSAHIELSSKVLDSVPKLERTLCHEMCHVAAWLINHTAKPPHGPVFKAWASRAMRVYPHLDITTCHQYDIFYAFRWQCTLCTQEYGRHSNSIDVKKKACGVCRGPLQFLGKFNRDGSPVKSRGPSAFSAFVKENFAAEKNRQAPGTPMSDIMKALGKKWAEKQQNSKDIRQSSTASSPTRVLQQQESVPESIDLTEPSPENSGGLVLDFFKLTLQ